MWIAQPPVTNTTLIVNGKFHKWEHKVPLSRFSSSIIWSYHEANAIPTTFWVWDRQDVMQSTVVTQRKHDTCYANSLCTRSCVIRGMQTNSDKGDHVSTFVLLTFLLVKSSTKLGLTSCFCELWRSAWDHHCYVGLLMTARILIDFFS